jgi:hypothetical protein
MEDETTVYLKKYLLEQYMFYHKIVQNENSSFLL